MRYRVACALDRLGRRPFDVLVHEGYIVPIEFFDLSAIADNALDFAGELAVERLLAKRADDHEDAGHMRSFRRGIAYHSPREGGQTFIWLPMGNL